MHYDKRLNGTQTEEQNDEGTMMNQSPSTGRTSRAYYGFHKILTYNKSTPYDAHNVQSTLQSRSMYDARGGPTGSRRFRTRYLADYRKMKYGGSEYNTNWRNSTVPDDSEVNGEA